MKVEIEIPEKFENDAKQHFKKELETVLCDLQFNTMKTCKHDIEVLEFLRDALMNGKYN